MSIKVEVVGAEDFIAKLTGAGEAAREEIGRAVQQGAYLVEGDAKSRAPVKTGTLRRSINTKATVDLGAAEARVGTRGLPYAHFQEYGFQGQVSVRQHLRTITKAWGKALLEPRQVMVSAHTREVKYAGKAFLRGALKDNADQIRAFIRNAVKKALGRA